MNEELLKQIDQEIENVRETLAKDIIHLISIKSVRGTPEPGAPFGPGPRAMLEAVVKLGEREGFVPTRYTDSVISISPQEGEPNEHWSTSPRCTRLYRFIASLSFGLIEICPHSPCESVRSCKVPAFVLPRTKVVSWLISALISSDRVLSNAPTAILSLMPSAIS